jgi:hypothetical protein
MVFKQDLTPLSKKGSITKHKGKGSQSAPMPNRNQLRSLQKAPTNTINDYAKASPVPQAPNDPTSGAGAVGLGSGNWAGNGM